VRGASVARVIGSSGLAADLASRSHRESSGRNLSILQDVLGANIRRREDGNKRCRGCGPGDIGASVGFLAFHQAHHPDNFESKFAGRLDGLNGGRSRRADIVYDDNARAFLSKPFDAAAGAVLFLRFANQKSVDRPAADGHRDHDRIGSYRESADRIRFPCLLTDFFQENVSNKLRTPGIEGRGAAVDVIVAGCTG